MSSVDRGSATPLWRQVGSDLRSRCANGSFADGVPGEVSLADEYGVSRHTIREALRDLRSEGVIRSQRGRGSVTRKEEPTNGPGSLATLLLAPSAREPAVAFEVLDESTLPDPRVARRLGLAMGTLWRIRQAAVLLDGAQVGLDTEWRSSEADIDETRDTITVVLPDRHLRLALAVPAAAPLWLIEQVGRSRGVAVQCRQTHLRAERFSIRTGWKHGGPSPLAWEPS